MARETSCPNEPPVGKEGLLLVSPDKALVLGRLVPTRRELGWWGLEKDLSAAICNAIKWNAAFAFTIIIYFIFCHRSCS